MASEIVQLARFVPRFIQQRLAIDPSVPEGCISEVLDAVVLFADVSGFTPLAVRLAEIGPEGAEQLDSILNKYYGRLVRLIDQNGGDIVAFAGDAAICVWNNAESALPALRSAAHAAREVQRELNRYHVNDQIQLSIRISIGAGQVVLANVGGLKQQWHPMVVGDAFDQLHVASQLAGEGDIVLSPQAASYLTGEASGERLLQDHLRLEKLLAITPTPAQKRRVDLPQSSAPALRSFIPRSVQIRLDAGHADWLADLRVLTVIFVKLNGVAELATAGLAQLQQVMLQLQHIMERFEGDVVHFLQDDKGIIAVLCFGLPPHIHEDDSIRAIRAATAIHRDLELIGLSADIGISSGRVFSGIRGGEERCEYSITGHVVNLAARLMSFADRGIVCDQGVQQSVRGGVNFECIPNLRLKGISEPVVAFRPALTDGKVRPAVQTLVGRSQELNKTRDWLTDKSPGQGRILVVEGEAGIGKSVLLQELARLARKRDMRVIQSECDVVDRATPFYALRSILREMLDVRDLSDRELMREAVLRALQFEPQLQERAALLNPILDCDFHESTIVSQLSSEARANLTQGLLLDILENAVRESPLVLVFDDVQWLDSVTWSFLSAVSNQLAGLFIVLAARPFSESAVDEARQLFYESKAVRLELGNLDLTATRRLVLDVVHASELDQELLDFVHQRAAGNPFFIAELAHFLIESGLIQVIEGHCSLTKNLSHHDAAEVPSSIRALITNRVDRLAPAQQMTIKTASVVGRSFAKKTLLAIYEVESDRGNIDQHLQWISQVRLIQVEALVPEISYLFQHLTVRQVVYDQIPVRNRRSLHLAIARWYEQTHYDSPGFYPVLAYHWGHANVPDKQVEYLAKAGEEALRRYANREAAEAFRAALEHSLELPEACQPSRSQIGHWNRLLGEAEFHLGDLTGARQHFEQALIEMGRRPAAGKFGSMLSALVQAVVQLFHRCFSNWTISQRIVADEEERSGGLHEASLAMQRLSQVHYLQVDMAQGISRALRGLNFAERAGKSPLLARSYAGMCVVTGVLRLHPLAKRYGMLSLQTAEETEHLPTVSFVLMATGVYFLGVGKWNDVQQQAKRSEQLARRIGDQRLLVEAITVEAMRSCFLGDHRGGDACYAEIYEIARTSENVVHLAWGFSGRGECAFRRGDHETALQCFEEAQRLLQASDHLTEEIRLPGFKAAGLWRMGRRQEAVSAARESLDIVQAAKYVTVSTLEGIAGTAEVLIGAYREHVRDQSARAAAIAACERMNWYARLFPVGRSRSACFRAQLLQCSGKPKAALRFWRQSIDWAKRHQLPYDEAFARLCLAVYGAVAVYERQQQLSFAAEAFENLGCDYELQWAVRENS